MHRIVRGILELVPRRRRRMWKYVSPRRRIVGLLTLALLVTLLYAYWHFTNDARIRRQAERALSELTAADVDVESASFDLFGGIRLDGVRVYLRDYPSSMPFVTARTVQLRHDPWSLVVRRTLVPTDIAAIEPVVNLEYSKDTDDSNVQWFLDALSNTRPADSHAIPTPRIQLTNGLLRSIVHEGRNRVTTIEQRMNVYMTPGPTGATYQVTVEGPQQADHAVEWAKVRIDLQSGDVQLLSGSLSTRVFKYLPPRQQEWMQRYEVSGDFSIANADRPDAIVELTLRDVSLRLPDEQGGLALDKVSGGISFLPEGVRLRGISGEVLDAGKARFTLDGEYDGYDADSPFEVRVGLHDIALPMPARGRLAEVLDLIRRKIRPEGPSDVDVTFRRTPEGQTELQGVVRPRDLAMTAVWFPVQLRDVAGDIRFNHAGEITLALHGQRDGARIQLDGRVHQQEDKFWAYDIAVLGQDVPASKEVREALPPRYGPVWDALQPHGRSDVRLRARKPARDEPFQLDIDLNFQRSLDITYTGFPYPLRNLSGEVEVRGDTVSVKWAQSEQDDMLIRLAGRASGFAKSKPDIALQLSAQRVPLDERLTGALQKSSRTLIESVSAGQISRVDATIRKKPETPLDYHVEASLRDATFQHGRFRYPIHDAAGRLTIVPDRIEVRNLLGKHGQTTVQLDGVVDTSGEEPVYDLVLQATDLTLDEQFNRALPEEMSEAWSAIQTSGLADLRLVLNTLPREEESTSEDPPYRLTVDAKGMTFRHEAFPYTFRGLRGRAILSPGRVELQKLSSTHDKATAEINGVISSTDTSDDATLRISARNLPLDKDLLAALPEDLLPLGKWFRPGGRVNAELAEIRFHRPNVKPEKRAVPKPLSQSLQEAQPKDKSNLLWWTVRGSVAFRDAAVDIGFGERTLTGVITGRASQVGKQLGIAAAGRLQSLRLGKRELTELRGRVSKSDQSTVLRIDGIEGNLAGGRLAGQAAVVLRDPVRYELSVDVTDVNLQTLVNPEKSPTMKQINGTLAGHMEFSARGGKEPTRQAKGELLISEGNMYELPVLLGVLNVIYLALPGESAFQEGHVRYVLRDDVLTFGEVYLTGQRLSVLGSGEWNLKSDKLNLTFLTGPPGKLQPMNEITEDVLRAFSKELVEIRVGGTLKQPEMTTHSLRSLETILNRLLSPSLKGQE